MVSMMGQLQYQSVAVSGSLVENLTNGLSGLGEKKRKIERIWFAEDWSGAPDNAEYAVAKVEQTEVLRFYLGHFKDLDTDTDQYLSVQRSIEMDLILERGQAFNVGFSLSGGTPGGVVTFAYRDLE